MKVKKINEILEGKRTLNDLPKHLIMEKAFLDDWMEAIETQRQDGDYTDKELDDINVLYETLSNLKNQKDFIEKATHIIIVIFDKDENVVYDSDVYDKFVNGELSDEYKINVIGFYNDNPLENWLKDIGIGYEETIIVED